MESVLAKKPYNQIILLTTIVGFAVALGYISCTNVNSLIFSLFLVLAVVLTRNIPEITLLALIFINEGLFDIVNTEKVGFVNLLYPANLVLGAVVLTIAVFFTDVWRDLDSSERKHIFLAEIALLLTLAVVEVINTYLLYGQSIFDGAMSNRTSVTYLLYFPLVYLMQDEKRMERIIKMIIVLGFIVACLNILQYVLWDKVSILQIDRLTIRNNDVRFLAGTRFLEFSVFVAMYKFLKNPGSRAYILMLVTQIIAIIVVGKTRVVIFALIVSFTYIIFKQKNRNYKTFYLTACLATVLFFVAYEGDNLITSLIKLTVDEVSSNTGNFGIRVKEALFYLEHIKEHVLLGVGNINYKYEYLINALYAEDKKYYTSDVGIIGFTLNYGFIGLVVLVLLMRKLFIGIQLIKKFDQSVYAIEGYLISSLVMIPTICIYNQSRPILYITILMALINKWYAKYEDSLSKEKTKENGNSSFNSYLQRYS